MSTRGDTGREGGGTRREGTKKYFLTAID